MYSILRGRLSPLGGRFLGSCPTPPPQVLPDCAHSCFSTPGTPGTSLKEIRRVCGGLMGFWKVPGLSHWRWKPVLFLAVYVMLSNLLRIPSVKQMQSLPLGRAPVRVEWDEPMSPHFLPIPPPPPLTACLPVLGLEVRWYFSCCLVKLHKTHRRTMDYSLCLSCPGQYIVGPLTTHRIG